MNAHSLVLAAVSPHLANLLSADAADPEGDGNSDGGADDGGKVNEDCNDYSDDSGNTAVRP